MTQRKLIDLTNYEFRTWKVISRIYDPLRSKKTLWLCRCNICNNERIIHSIEIRKDEVGYCKCQPKRRKMPIKDITNIESKDWIIKDVNQEVTKGTNWNCECKKCGKIKIINSYFLRKNKRVRCICEIKKEKNIIGQKFNHLTIKEEKIVFDGKKNNKFCLCICDCGSNKEKWIDKYSVLNGHAKSCGCVRKKRKENSPDKNGKNHGRFIDITGNIYNNWKIERLHSVGNGPTSWEGKCVSCGLTKILDGAELRMGKIPYCNCEIPARQEIIGKKFNKLTVISEIIKKRKNNNKTDKVCLCECECGNRKEIKKSSLINGHTKSCGSRKCWCGLFGSDGDGYISVTVHNHPNSGKKGRIKEHILVMSNFLGRPLQKGEFVHHKNGLRYDNQIENLELWNRIHPIGSRVKDLIEYARYVLETYKDFKDTI